MAHNLSFSAPSQTVASDAARSSTLVAALMAACMGVFFVWGVGFSHIGVFHNAAHDTRHSNAFPCH